MEDVTIAVGVGERWLIDLLVLSQVNNPWIDSLKKCEQVWMRISESRQVWTSQDKS